VAALLILLAMVVPLVQPGGAHASADSAAITTEAVSVVGAGGVELDGVIVRPADAGAARPGIVLVHGAGPHEASDYLGEAEAFARAGIVALAYDKRTDGYSMFERSYETLAADAIAAVRTLRRHQGVDPGRVGVWGLSEGGWVAPLAAARSEDIAFVVTIAGTGVSPARQEAWAKANRLRAAGVTGSLLDAYAITATRWAVATDLFAEATHDPVEVLAEVDQPILAIWGADDTTSPPAENLRIFEEALRDRPSGSVRLAVIEGAGHDGRPATADSPSDPHGFAPGYLDLMTSWVVDPAGARAGSAAVPPVRQEVETRPILPLRWWEPAWVLISALGLAILALVAYLLAAVGGRVAGRSDTATGSTGGVVFAVIGLVTVIGLYGYFGLLLMTGEKDPGPVIGGRALPWLVLQLLSVAAIIALARAVVAIRHGTAGRSKLQRLSAGLLAFGAVAWVPWAVYWGLLLP
jgi:hypothetical protein